MIRWTPVLRLLPALALAVTAAQAQAVEIVCHRGANTAAPENTYAAAQVCIDWGVEYVEVDVRRSKDGVMYILHDETVDRTTNGTGPIAEIASDDIDRLDAGSWFDEKFANERIPRLGPYLRRVKGKIKVYFDVKDADLEQLIALIYEVGLEKDCFFWFGDRDRALEFRRLNRELPLKINVRNPADVSMAADRFGAHIAEVRLEDMSEELVTACRERGLKVMVYHPEKDPEAFREIIRWGADMVNLDHADVFQQVAGEMEQTTLVGAADGSKGAN